MRSLIFVTLCVIFGSALVIGRGSYADTKLRSQIKKSRRPISTLTPDHIDISDMSRFFDTQQRAGCDEILLKSDIEQKLSWNTEYSVKSGAWSGFGKMAGLVRERDSDRVPAALSTGFTDVDDEEFEIDLHFSKADVALDGHHVSRFYLKNYTSIHKRIFAYLIVIHDLVSRMFEGQVRSIHSLVYVPMHDSELDKTNKVDCSLVPSLQAVQVAEQGGNPAACYWVHPNPSDVALCW